MKLFKLGAIATSVLGLSTWAVAVPIGQTLPTGEVYLNSGGNNYTNASALAVSSSDLINGLAASSTNYVGGNEASGGSVNVLTDGSTGTGTSDPTSASNAAFDINTNWYAVWTLPTTANVGSIIVTTGHKDSRVNQRYDILLSTDGTTYTSLSDGSTTTTLGTAGTGFNYSPSSATAGPPGRRSRRSPARSSPSAAAPPSSRSSSSPRTTAMTSSARSTRSSRPSPGRWDCSPPAPSACWPGGAGRRDRGNVRRGFARASRTSIRNKRTRGNALCISSGRLLFPDGCAARARPIDAGVILLLRNSAEGPPGH